MIRKTLFALAALGTLASSTPAALTLTAGATVALTAIAATPAEAANTCKSAIRASGESAGAVAKFRKRRAERRAKGEWEQKVRFEHGGRFADFDSAKNVKFSCDLNARGNTRCTIVATPCG